MKPRQTATPEQAMAMLARAVAAVQADKTKRWPCSTRKKAISGRGPISILFQCR
jgi:hypothetical protein